MSISNAFTKERIMEERVISLYIEIEKLFHEQYKEYKEFKRYGKAFNYGKLTAYYRCLQEIEKHFDFIQFLER